MLIALRVDHSGLRRWVIDLASRLAWREGVRVTILLADAAPRPWREAALFGWETALFGLPRNGLSRPVAPADALALFPATADEPDLIIDLSKQPLQPGSRVWGVECDGHSLEAGLLAAALSGASPVVRVLGQGMAIVEGRPGAENGGLAISAFEERLARVATLILAALDSSGAPRLPALPERQAAPAATPSLLDAALNRLKRRALRTVYEGLFHTPHWRVGWRRRERSTSFELGGDWRAIPDDGKRFYADPFPIVWRGRTYLFVEEFEHTRSKGIISCVEFDAAGPVGAPRPVLETGTHLSYPFVFERDGDVWMVPESCAAGVIDLYRASCFPDAWVREATLVENIQASDATLVEHGGRWWMFSTVRDGGGAFSDALHLWSAPDFRGPWTPHPRNPVLVDIATARPAGAFFADGDTLYRPFQDCRRGYGAAMGLARIDKLDDQGFAQSVVRLVNPADAWGGRRLHSYNAGGGFEFIDGSATAAKWRPTLKRWSSVARHAPATRVSSIAGRQTAS